MGTENSMSTSHEEVRGVHISWEEYHMGLAILSAARSASSCKRSGCCIILKDNRPAGFGHNTVLPIELKLEDEIDARKYEACSSHTNVVIGLMVAPTNLDALTLYTTHLPVHGQCVMSLSQIQLAKLYYLRQSGDMPATLSAALGPDCPITHFSSTKLIEALENEILSDNSHESLTKSSPIFPTGDAFYMTVAWLTAQRSNHPTSQVGACLVDQHNRIVATGCNGFSQRSSSCAIEDIIVEHAESSAILGRLSDSVAETTMYVTLFPCWWCANWMVLSKVRRIVYLDTYDEYKQARCSSVCAYLQSAGVCVQRIKLDDVKFLQVLEAKGFGLRMKLAKNFTEQRQQPALEETVAAS